MSQETRNVETLRNLYAHWNATKGAGVDHWMNCIADAVSFGSLAHGRPDSLAFTKARQGREDVRHFLEELAGDWSMIDYVVDQYVAESDRVVAIGRMSWRNKRTGKIIDSPKLDIWRFNDAGKATEFFEYYDTAAAIAAAT